MIDSIVVMIVGLVGILTPLLILGFGLALIVGLSSVLKAAYDSMAAARRRRSVPVPRKKDGTDPPMPECPTVNLEHGPAPDCRIAA